MAGHLADKARARRIEALQAMRTRHATKPVPTPVAKPSRFPPVDKVLAALSNQEPLRLMAA